MKYLLLALTVTAVAGQLPLPCTSPRQFESRFARFDREKNFQEFAKVSYDEDQKRVREIEEVAIGSTKDYYDVLYLHNIGIEYRFNLRTRKCNVTTISKTFIPFSVPGFAKFAGQGNIGVAGFTNEHVDIQLFEGKTPEGHPLFISVTSPDCFPVNFGYYSPTVGYDHRNFYDVTVGIRDPNVFIPPSECIQ
ncbi:hypothetical protein LOTGIDRAFT_233900 [Lottia gigantea]|uniref:Mammalian ependymin-related protein 1 n=1 Tax=Lottia gigantea TaxID=225164 RepID=V4A0A4_LOTGI|nr:hypothetical protein LOTGIDRAFT_233900 [Lottia gigantea]ESO90087.1 hypothetical protein LOTGIDRAFT_233900 [Lottia gigantea]